MAMSPKTRIIGFLVCTFFLVLYGYLLGFFQLDFLSYPKLGSVASVVLVCAVLEGLLEIVKRRNEELERSIGLAQGAVFVGAVIAFTLITG